MTTELYREVSGSGDPLLLTHGNGANTRIEGTAHAVHFDRPEQFRDAVLAAANRAAPLGATAK